MSGLLNGLVESLRGGVAVVTEDLVLGKEHALDTAHEDTTLTVEVRVDLLLEGGLVGVARADGDSESGGLFVSLASDILEDGNGGLKRK